MFKLPKSYEFLPGTMKPPKYIVMTSKDALGISHASHFGKETKMIDKRSKTEKEEYTMYFRSNPAHFAVFR